jgi:hypothetical protein
MIDNQPQADIAKEKKPEQSESEKKRLEYIEQRKVEAQECTKEFNALLLKYNCFAEIQIVLSTHNRLKGNLVIQPRI